MYSGPLAASLGAPPGVNDFSSVSSQIATPTGTPATMATPVRTVTVTAQKEPADPQTLPISLTAVPLDSLWNGGLLTLGDFSIYSPNTYFTDFTDPHPLDAIK